LQGTTRGIALEHIVGLCNAAHVNPWICIPTSADDDYVRKMAEYVHANLNPDLKVYLEWSNESWNTGYPGYTVAYAMGRYLNLAGNAAYSYHAYHATKIFHIWNEVYGLPQLSAERAGLRDPLVRVLASQAASKGVSTAIVNFNAWKAGDPENGHKAAEFADALAIAPYFGFISADSVESLSVSELLDQTEAAIDTMVDWTRNNLDVAQSNNLNIVAYEGGQNISFSALTNEEYAKIAPYAAAYMASPRWRSILVKYLEAWSAIGKDSNNKGVGLFCLFNLFGNLSKYGYWAHKDQQLTPDDPNPRWQGILDYLSSRQTPVPPNELFGSPVSAHSVQLRWNDNSTNETGFELERKNASAPTFQLAASLTSGASLYLDAGLEIGKSYRYRLRAINSSGPSEYSNEILVMLPSVETTVPETPREAVASQWGASVLRLTWRDTSTTETKFVIERRDPNSTEFAPIGEVDPNSSVYIDSGLNAAETCTYRVSACRGAWCSTPSNETTAVTAAAWSIPDGDPLKLGSALILPSSIKISWQDTNTAEIGYQIQRRAPGETAYSPVASLPPDSAQYIDTDLTPGAYFYRLVMTKADAAIWTSTDLMEVVPTAQFLSPIAPDFLTATVVVPGRVELAWTDMSDNETEFDIERKTDNSEIWEEIGRSLASVAKYEDFPNMAIANSYRYRVRARNAAGVSEPSNEVVAYPLVSGRDANSGNGGSILGNIILPATPSVIVRFQPSQVPCSAVIRIVSRMGVVREMLQDVSISPATISWDIRNKSNSRVGSGTYFVRGECGGRKLENIKPNKLVVIK
jgi:hypothetical protein